MNVTPESIPDMVISAIDSDHPTILDSLSVEPLTYADFLNSPVSDSEASEASASSFYSQASSATSYSSSPCTRSSSLDLKQDTTYLHSGSDYQTSENSNLPPAPTLETASLRSDKSDDGWPDITDTSLLALSPLGDDVSRWNHCVAEREKRLGQAYPDGKALPLRDLLNDICAVTERTTKSAASTPPPPSQQYTHPRRTSASECGPKRVLVREEDRRSEFVTHLILCATQLVAFIWPNSNTQISNPACSTPVISLPFFIRETLRRSKTSYNTLLVALYYLALAKSCGKFNFCSGSQPQTFQCPLQRALHCGRRMFLASLILASKYLQDRNFSARAWSKISSLPVKEINLNERALLDAIQWKLHVRCDNFQRWNHIIMRCVNDARLTKLCPWQMIVDRLPKSEMCGTVSDPSISDVSGEDLSENLSLREKPTGLKLDIPAAPILGLDLTTPPLSADTPAASTCAQFPDNRQLTLSSASEAWKAPRAFCSFPATSKTGATEKSFGANVYPPSPALTNASSGSLPSAGGVSPGENDPIYHSSSRPVTARRMTPPEEVDCVRRSMGRRRPKATHVPKFEKSASCMPTADIDNSSATPFGACARNYRQMAFCNMNPPMQAEQYPTAAASCGDLKRRGSFGLKRCGASKVPRAS